MSLALQDWMFDQGWRAQCFMPAQRDFATIVAVETPLGFLLVRDVLRFGVDAKLKFTGGEGLPGETPCQGGIREVGEESGVIVPQALMIPYRPPIAKHSRKTGQPFDIFTFTAKVSNLPTDGTLKRRADEGEETDISPATAIMLMADDLYSPVPRSNRDFLYFQYEIFQDHIRQLAGHVS